MELNLTNEETEALKTYKGLNYESINQLLISNCETDLVLLESFDGEMNYKISYDKLTVTRNIEIIKKVYELMLKVYNNVPKKEDWMFSRGTNISEIDRLKNEPYIDKFLSTTKDSKKAKEEFSAVWNRPVVMNIHGKSNIPYIVIDEVLGVQNDSQEVIISPFTKITDIKDKGESKLTVTKKTLSTYDVFIEKQELEQLTEAERNGLYNFIIENADSINAKLQYCMKLEEENITNYENIRKLEQLLSKYEAKSELKEAGKDYSDSEKQADLDDINRINNELNEIKIKVSELFELRKECINYITTWKKNIVVYLMAECKEIELVYQAESKVVKEKQEKKQEKYEEEAKAKHEKIEQETIEATTDNITKECRENIERASKLLEDVKLLIYRQQNHAKIAEILDVSYSALNSGFEMKKNAERLENLLIEIQDHVNKVCTDEDKTLLEDKLIYISKVNTQISTLMNYLNNPKVSIKDKKTNRFEELYIIEENELKRQISEKIRNVAGKAELKKLKDDMKIIDEKGTFVRFIGVFTGQNKLDEFILDQIELREKAINRTLARRLSLANGYSIHDMVATINMFDKDNEEDELVKDEVKVLNELEEELRRNFIISNSRVQDIVDTKEGKNLPIEGRKINKKEFIEIETYRFLNKYGYDIEKVEEEPQYQDTMANEIKRIIKYIESSNII